MVLVFGATGGHAAGANFSATYRELAPSPANFATTWYSGAVTRDGKFIYGLGNSHNAHGNNGLWLYDPATDTHESVFPSTGRRWKWQDDANKKVVPESGRWADPAIRALTNRNNHQAFYMPARNEFWVLAGTTFYQASPYFGGRFSLDTRRWEYLSPPWGEKTRSDLADFSAGLIAGTPGWVAPNAATAVCADLNTVVLFGGMNGRGGVRIIEPNPAGPEPYRWAGAPPPPIHQPAENVRHNAACVGDTVYFVSGQERVRGARCCRTPDPAPFWKFHVPSRAWTRLPDGPPGAYFTVVTYDSAADALLVYGGSASNRLWVYDLQGGAWHDLTGTVPDLPRADMHTGGYIPGFGHVYKGGKRYDEAGKDQGYGASAGMMRIVLRRDGGAGVSAAAVPARSAQAVTTTAESPVAEAQEGPQTIVQRVLDRRQAAAAEVSTTQHATLPAEKAAVASADPPVDQRAGPRVPTARSVDRPVDPPRKRTSRAVATAAAAPVPGGAIRWTRLALPGWPKSPQSSMKHQRLVEGPGGRVYLLGGDWGGGPKRHTGRQEVFSFDPLSRSGEWRMEASNCGTKANPVHWHTDEAGVAWDARRKVFWKVAGTEYGPGRKDPSQDSCLAAGRSVKAKVITFDPATRLWTVPAHVAQTRFGYVTNGILDPEKDEMVQVTDRAVKHLNLSTGEWTSHPLPDGPKRFNAIAARVGREVYWCNRKQVLESYNLDTHAMTTHSVAPWPVPARGWEMQMVMPYRDKLVVVRPVARPDSKRQAAIYDPASRQWATLDPGEGWGNTGMVHSSGKLILMGGGIDGPAHHNKFVWVGDLP